MRLDGDEEVLPGLMSATIMVPAAVPSLIHNSKPCAPSSASKKSVPLTLVKKKGLGEALSGLMSFTISVPAAVPSLFHSSRPDVGSSAEKKSVPLTLVRLPGNDAPMGL